MSYEPSLARTQALRDLEGIALADRSDDARNVTDLNALASRRRWMPGLALALVVEACGSAYTLVIVNRSDATIALLSGRAR